MINLEMIDNLKKMINESSADPDVRKGTNNLLFTILMAERGSIPQLPDSLEAYLKTTNGRALEVFYFNLRSYINDLTNSQ